MTCNESDSVSRLNPQEVGPASPVFKHFWHTVVGDARGLLWDLRWGANLDIGVLVLDSDTESLSESGVQSEVGSETHDAEPNQGFEHFGLAPHQHSTTRLSVLKRNDGITDWHSLLVIIFAWHMLLQFFSSKLFTEYSTGFSDSDSEICSGCCYSCTLQDRRSGPMCIHNMDQRFTRTLTVRRHGGQGISASLTARLFAQTSYATLRDPQSPLDSSTLDYLRDRQGPSGKTGKKGSRRYRFRCGLSP